MEWFSYLIASVLGLSAILSPWFVSKHNNETQLKLKKLELYENSKRESLNDFIDICQKYFFSNNDPEIMRKYYLAVDRLFIYFDKLELQDFLTLNNYANKEFSKENLLLANYELSEMVTEISKQIPKE